MTCAKWTAGLSATLVAGAIGALPRPAAAQVPGANVRIDQLEIASAFSPFTRAEGPHSEFDEGIEYAFRLTGDYMYEPLRATVVDPSIWTMAPEEVYLVDHALLLHLGAAIAPMHWLAIEAAMPFAVYESGEGMIHYEQRRRQDHEGVHEYPIATSPEVEPGEAGVGDPRFGLLFRPHTSDELDATVGVRVWLPFGQDEAYLHGNQDLVRLDVVGALAGEADSFLWGCTLAVSPFFLAARDGDRLGLSCAGHFNATPMFSFGLEPHAAMFVFQGTDETADGTQLQRIQAVPTDDWGPGWDNVDLGFQLEPLGVARFHLGGFSVGIAAGPGIGNAPGTPAFRGNLTVAYEALGEPVVVEHGPPDADLDGIPDDEDECPKQAGPEDRQGCPEEQDADGDGIIEGDACPDEPGARSDDAEANGCPDRDNDRLADPIDPCPREPGPNTGGCPKYARLAGLESSGPVRFRIKPPIGFKRRSAKLQDKSIEAIREIVRTMRANPKLEQVSMTVGTKGASQRLTDERAKTILLIFKEDQDFDTNRFEVVLGDDLPAGKVTVRIIQ